MTQEYLNQIEALLRERLEAGDVDAVMRLGAILDTADITRPAQYLQVAAGLYAERGIPVFPCRARGKQPATSHGFKDATTDCQIVLDWWALHPDANIGTPTGLSFDVIDIDGPLGVTSWSKMLDDGALPEVIGQVSTPRDGGTHLYVAPRGRGNATKFLPGIDYRGAGGYVLLPPSVTDEHGPGRTYRWLRELP